MTGNATPVTMNTTVARTAGLTRTMYANHLQLHQELWNWHILNNNNFYHKAEIFTHKYCFLKTSWRQIKTFETFLHFLFWEYLWVLDRKFSNKISSTNRHYCLLLLYILRTILRPTSDRRQKYSIDYCKQISELKREWFHYALQCYRTGTRFLKKVRFSTFSTKWAEVIKFVGGLLEPFNVFNTTTQVQPFCGKVS